MELVHFSKATDLGQKINQDIATDAIGNSKGEQCLGLTIDIKNELAESVDDFRNSLVSFLHSERVLYT